jgi:uncharacterized membrane protein YtjA (UPF0391 family)
MSTKAKTRRIENFQTVHLQVQIGSFNELTFRYMILFICIKLIFDHESFSGLSFQLASIAQLFFFEGQEVAAVVRSFLL